MTRRQWYSEQPSDRGSFHIPPLASWSGNSILLLTLVVVLFLQLVVRGLTDYLWLVPADLINPLNWYTLVTYALAHDTKSVIHILGNGLILYFLGPSVEGYAGGRKPYFLFCAMAAVFAALAHVVVEVIAGEAARPMLGASGIAYAVVVAFATIDPHRVIQLIFPPLPIKAWALAAIFMGLALFWQLSDSGRTVADMAHLGGGVFGFLYVRHRGFFQSAWARYRLRQQNVERRRAVDKEKELDRLLEKISKHGISSLSKAERRFLDLAAKERRNRH